MTVQAHLIRLADRFADAFGILERPLAAEELIAAARQRAKWQDFGDDRLTEPLPILLRAYDQDAALSLFGRMAVRWDVIRLLTNLLRFNREEQAAPQILAAPIPAPIFVTGLPRSGTTFLHSLLAEDPGNRVPRCWQTIFPYPDPSRPPNGHDPRPDIVDRQLRLFEGLAPGFRSVHPLDARSPQECTEITAHTFRSFRFDTTHHIPSYRSWFEATGHLEPYRFHKRFLQHLQSQPDPRPSPGRWVLKSPDHVFALDAIEAVYPDARIIFVHRDPLRVLSSVANLTGILRKPLSRRVDPAQIGQQVSGDWGRAVSRMIEAGRGGHLAGGPIVHVHYRTLVTRPFETVETVYRALGIELSGTAAARIKAAIAARPDGGYGRNHHRLENYGLEPAREQERFHDYMTHFGVEPEWKPPAA